MRGAINVSIANWRHGADGSNGVEGNIDGADKVQDNHFGYCKDNMNGVRNMDCMKDT